MPKQIKENVIWKHLFHIKLFILFTHLPKQIFQLFSDASLFITHVA